MKSSLPVVALVALLSPSLATVVKSRSPYVVKGSHPVPSRWERMDRADPDHPVELRIGLKQSEFNELERQLYESKWATGGDLHLLTAHRV